MTCERAGVANRPHVKTHKNSRLAAMQIAAGAKGITCQKLGEAEIMSAAGIDDILITYNLLGAEKIGRLGRLLATANVTVTADNAFVIAGLPEAARAAGRALPVAIECDTGRKRAGVDTPAQAISLARDVDARADLTFAGLVFYPPEDGWLATRTFFDETVQGLREAGISCPMISTGGTPNLVHLGELPGTTEHRSGTSIFNDRMMLDCGAAALADCALHVITTVVSRAAPNRGILDAGSKTLSSDVGKLKGFGLLPDYPDAVISALAEEHGFLDLSMCGAKPGIGDVVRVVPNHVCVAVNLANRFIAVRGSSILGPWSVEARGRTD